MKSYIEIKVNFAAHNNMNGFYNRLLNEEARFKDCFISLVSFHFEKFKTKKIKFVVIEVRIVFIFVEY